MVESGWDFTTILTVAYLPLLWLQMTAVNCLDSFLAEGEIVTISRDELPSRVVYAVCDVARSRNMDLVWGGGSGNLHDVNLV